MKTYKDLTTLPEIAQAIVDGCCEVEITAGIWIKASSDNGYIDMHKRKYRRVEEVEDGEPEIGEPVYVSDVSAEQALTSKLPRRYIKMLNGFYLVKTEDDLCPIGWKYIARIPKEKKKPEEWWVLIFNTIDVKDEIYNSPGYAALRQKEMGCGEIIHVVERMTEIILKMK